MHDYQRPSCIMSTIALGATSQVTNPPATGGRDAVGIHGFSFRDLLSALNPLQYLPVVGTIYRAVTGDVIPESLRHAGSMIVSGPLGGPVGVITYIASTIAQKVLGLDPEKIISARLYPTPSADMPDSARGVAPNAAAIVTLAAVSATAASPVGVALGRVAWTSEQLASYGVRVDPSGKMKLGKVEGADVLNTIELMQLRKGAVAYASNQGGTTVH
jgi:hypothetical protein